MTKYRAKKTVVDGIRFDSKAEAMYYLYLKSEKQQGRIKEIELQPEFVIIDEYEINGRKQRATKYVADFRVTYADGRVEVIDVKGVKTPVYKLKKRLVESRYGIEILEIS